MLRYAVLLPVLLCVAAGQGADPLKGEPAVEKFRRTLEQPLTVDFNGITLASAVEALRQQTKLNIVLDRASLQSMAINADDLRVTLKLHNVKLRTVLKQLLGQCNLSYVLDGDIMVITIDEVAIQRQVRQRVSLEFDKVPLERALKHLSRETATNLVIDPRQAAAGKSPITLTLEDVPLEVAVRLAAELAGLRSVRQGNVLFLTTKEVAAELRKQEESSPALPSYGNWMDRIQILGGGGMAFPAGGVPVPAVPAAPPADAPADKPAEKPPDPQKKPEPPKPD